MIVGAQALDEFLRKETDILLVQLVVSDPHLRDRAVGPIQLDAKILEEFARPLQETARLIAVSPLPAA